MWTSSPLLFGILLESYYIFCCQSWSDLVHALHSDRVLCHFCFKPKKVTNEVAGADNARRSQVLISSIILLKTALDALPLLSKVNRVLLYLYYEP